MKRGRFFSVSLGVATLAAALSPLGACAFGGFDSAASSGEGGGDLTSTEESGGGYAGTGGGPVRDAAVDVTTKTDDPPPFTGKSYCSFCGGKFENGVCDGLGCDTAGGACSDAGPTTNGMGCKLGAGDGGDQVSAACGVAGTGGDGAVCSTSDDCLPGFGCIDGLVDSASVCRQYCCGDPDQCASGHWCVPKTLADGKAQVPVCVHADGCSLLDDSRPCPDGLSCTIVRNDGTTACARSGTGSAGDACPCAEGYVCSQLADKCFKLCHVGSENECGDGQCVGGMGGYPDGIGTCVGL
jgi:hypothetical protein